MFIIPTLHPNRIMQQNLKLSGLVELGIQRAASIARGQWKPKWVDESKVVILRPDAGTVETVLRSMHGKKVAFDVETDGRHVLKCDLRCIAFYDGERAICVPLLRRTGNYDEVLQRAEWVEYFTGATKIRVLKALKELLQNCTLLTQNGQYDRAVVHAQTGIRVPSGFPHFDTIIGHHLVAPYLPHGLGLLAALYTESPYYKATAGGDAWSSESDHELWLYNARDVIVTWQVAMKMMEEVHELPQHPALYEHDAWQEGQCEEWREAGVALDPFALRFFQSHYRSVMGKAMTRMRGVVKDIGSSSGDEALAELLDKLEVKAIKKAEKDGIEAVEEFNADGSGRTVEMFNPASLNQLRTLLHAIGIPLTEKTATGQLSTKREVLTGIRKELLEKGVKDDDVRVAFLDYLFAWRESSKVDSTYLQPELLKGRVHPTFSMHVVPTGRLCLAEWTKVLTKERGWVEVKDVRHGERVWTHHRRWKKVKNVFFNGTRGVFDLKLKTGQVLTSTTDHRFFGADGNWVTVGELRECLEKLGSIEVEPGGRSSALPKPELALEAGHLGLPWGDVCDGRRGPSVGDVCGGPQSSFSAEVLGVEDRQQEPNARQEGTQASPLEGPLRGWARLPDDSLEGEANLRSSPRDDAGIGLEEVAAFDGGSSHRREQAEQRAGQLGSHDGEGAPADSLPSGEGLARCVVEAVVPRGRCETVDLEVEDDHSFLIEGGVFSHNCSQNPNFQNQPPEIRGMYVADEGHELVYEDWDALEMRLGAYNSEDKNFIEVFRAYDAGEGPKPHIVNMSVIFGLPATKEAAEKNPAQYTAAKTFAYAAAYGAGPTTQFEQAREAMPDLNFKTFMVALGRYKKQYQRLFQFQQEVVTQGCTKGYLDSPILKRRVYFFERGYGESSPEATAMQNFPYQAGGSDVVQLANRRVQDELVRPWQKKLRKGEKLVQLAQVHDELLFLVPKRLVADFKVELKRLSEIEVKKGWKLPVDVKSASRWKPVKSRCTECGDATEMTMTSPDVWEGVCSKKHPVKVTVNV